MKKMGKMRHNILQNLHLSRVPLDISFENLLFNKESFKVSVSGRSQTDAWIMPGILGITGSTLLIERKTNLTFNDSSDWMDTHFFGSSFNNMYNIYFNNLSSFVSDWASVTHLPHSSNFYIVLDWCTNFYNAYDNLSWFPYVEKPSFFVCLLNTKIDNNPIEKYSRLCYLSVYFSKNPC